MSYEFEGKTYSSIRKLHAEWFPTRSGTWVRRYILLGAKTVADVVKLSEQANRQATINRIARQATERDARK